MELATLCSGGMMGKHAVIGLMVVAMEASAREGTRPGKHGGKTYGRPIIATAR